jgi:DNA-binding transcriptional MerR regulator
MNFHTTGDVAKLFGVKVWQVRRLFEDGTLPEPPRHGSYRAIPQESLAPIARVLADRGWLAKEVQA